MVVSCEGIRMVHPAVVDGSDPKAVRDTRVLIDCLQELVKGAERPVRNCAKYPEVVWLGDLPEGMLHPDAATGRRLLVAKHRPVTQPPALPAVLRGRVSATAAAVPALQTPGLVEVPPAEDGQDQDGGPAAITDGSQQGFSEAVTAYGAWAQRWQRWSRRELAEQPYRRQYQQLYRMAKKVQQDSDGFEVVLAVGLVQIGAGRPSARVRRHLLTVPVTVAVDQHSVEITVDLAVGMSCRLEDSDFLSESDGYTSEFIAKVRAEVDDDAFHPLSDRGTQALATWAQRAFGLDRAVPFDPGADHPDLTQKAGEYSVHRAPALILREHGRRSVLGFYESIARSLKQPGARSPLGLAQLLYDLERPQRIAWGSGGRPVPPALGGDPLFPMVTNAAQHDVLDKLQRETSVVVQGPPGTGKTHTISNLVAALLAEGKRVLVTSAKSKALEVLRGQLPPRMRSLCVLQHGPWQGGSSDLQHSLGALAHLSSTTDRTRLRARIETNEQLRLDLMAHQASLRDRLRAVRETEWYEHAEERVAPGYQGRLDGIVEAVERGADACAWLPTLSAGAQAWPPLDADEARHLVRLGALHGRQIFHSPAQSCPDPAGVPAPQDVARALARLDDTESSLTHQALPLAEHLAAAGADRLETIEALAATAQQSLQRVGLSADPGTWQEDQWTTRALGDGISRQWQPSWDSIRNASHRARQTQDDVAASSFPDVDIPELSDSQEKEYLAAGRELEQHVLHSGMPGRRWPKPAVVKNASFLLQKCHVEGRKPTQPQQIVALVRHLEMRAHARTLRERWQGVGAPPMETADAQRTVAELLDRAYVLEAVDACVQAIHQVHQTLLALGADMPVTTPDQWRTVREAVGQARGLLQLQAAADDLQQILASLPQPAPGSAPEVQQLVETAAARDADGYRDAVAALERAYRREADRREAGKLFQRLSQAHHALAVAFSADPADPVWEARFEALPQAWAWRLAGAFLKTQMQPGREEELAGVLARTEARLKDVVEELACDRAAEHCLDRMTNRHKRALAAYAQAMANAGQASTSYGKRHLSHARSAMKEAQSAVPAWIMPLRQVAETIAPEPDSFDVVIVDEASQVGLDGLFLLWLAPRIIVVGDDRQCAPQYNASKHDRITQIFDERMAELIPWQREGFDPKSNLYELLTARFPDVVRLTEHFRCMPEIIKWSSDQFYKDNRLVLLRQHGADRLPPLKTVHVPEGHCQGRDERLINRPEAEAVVEQLRLLTQDPAYEKRSLGVIVLRYGLQERLVQDLVYERIDPAARERHNIMVGGPEQFQGDQRDVILLSMVVDGDHARAVTKRSDQRRFNVAASRARDQMWLFHTVTADQLSSKDLRHSLLTYMRNPPPPYPPSPALDSVSSTEQHQPFESLFEQRVFRQIKQRGYHVVPQWEISSKRIDLVVIGDHARLAVECDGSPHHSTTQQIHDDAERERELRRAGWTFWRLRSSAFALDPEEALTPLWDTLTAMGIHPLTPVAAGSDGDETAPAWTPVGLSDDELEDDQDDDPYDPDGMDDDAVGGGSEDA